LIFLPHLRNQACRNMNCSPYWGSALSGYGLENSQLMLRTMTDVAAQ